MSGQKSSPVSLPDITLTAAGSGREFSLATLGIPAVLILHGQETASAAAKVNRTVRKEYPLASEIVIASIVDLRAVPRMFRRFANGAMGKAYHRIVEQLPDDAVAEEYAVILPDWKGAVNQTVGIEGTDTRAAVVVSDADGQIVGVHQGEGLGAATLDMLLESGIVG